MTFRNSIWKLIKAEGYRLCDYEVDAKSMDDNLIYVVRFCRENGILLKEQTETPAYDTRAFVIKSMVGYFIKDACKTSIPKIEEYIDSYSPDYSSLYNCINKK